MRAFALAHLVGTDAPLRSRHVARAAATTALKIMCCDGGPNVVPLDAGRYVLIKNQHYTL